MFVVAKYIQETRQWIYLSQPYQNRWTPVIDNAMRFSEYGIEDGFQYGLLMPDRCVLPIDVAKSLSEESAKSQ